MAMVKLHVFFLMEALVIPPSLVRMNYDLHVNTDINGFVEKYGVYASNSNFMEKG